MDYIMVDAASTTNIKSNQRLSKNSPPRVGYFFGLFEVVWSAFWSAFFQQPSRPQLAALPVASTKGPINNVDWFRVRWELADQSARTALTIRHKANELADTVRSLTPDGQAESLRRAGRVVAAQSDAAYQQFKAAVGIPTRQGRRKEAH